MAEYHFDVALWNFEIGCEQDANFLIRFTLLRCGGDFDLNRAVRQKLRHFAGLRSWNHFEVNDKRSLARESGA